MCNCQTSQIRPLCNPCNPCVTYNPCQPCNPCKPCNPCVTYNPCKPCNPCKPRNHCKPCNPCKPEKTRGKSNIDFLQSRNNYIMNKIFKLL